MGQTLLGQVNPRHDLHSVDHRALHSFGNVVALDAYAVNAIPYTDAVGHRLDVNIAGPHLDRFVDDHRDQANDRGGALIERLVAVDVAPEVADLFFEAVDRLVDAHVGPHELVNVRPDACPGGQAGQQLPSETKTEHVQRAEVLRIGDDDLQASAFLAQRNHVMLANQVFRYRVHLRADHDVPLEVDVLHVELRCQGLGNVFLVSRPQHGQRLADSHALIAGVFQGFLDGRLRYNTPCYKDFSQPSLLVSCHGQLA